MAKKGLILGLEGLDKCGKGTQLDLLVNTLKELNVDFEVDREPGGTSYGEIERRCLLDSNFIERVNKGYANVDNADYLTVQEELSPEAEMFGFFKARAQFYAKRVKPVIDRSGVFVTDRTGMSTYAYQGFMRFDADEDRLKFILEADKVAQGGLGIERVWYLDISVEEMAKRKSTDEFGKGNDRMEKLDLSMFEKIKKGYDHYAVTNPHVNIIDGTMSVEDVRLEIVKDLRHRLFLNDQIGAADFEFLTSQLG